MNWMTIDFEASCLPRHGKSYPIEVGISGPLGTQSWLIKPLPQWRDWDWTAEASSLHGITQQQLHDEGQEPAIVMAQVLRAVGTSRVIADSTIDRIWWDTLVNAATPVLVGATPPIQSAPACPGGICIEHVGDVLEELNATPEQIRSAQLRADRLCLGRHRAGNDARWLYTLLHDLTRPVETDRTDPAAPVSPDRSPVFPDWTTHRAYLSTARQSQTTETKP
jgi:hypothetical protein